MQREPYMHIEHLSISLKSIYSDSVHDESISSNEVPYTPFFLFRLGPGVGLNIELESGGKLNKEKA